MSTAAVGNQVIFNFAWRGPNTWKGGMENDGLSADQVCLEFEGAKTKYSVELPQNIGENELHELSFTCRRSNQVGQITITTPKFLTPTPGQMRQLSVKVRVLGKGDPIGPRMCDPVTGRITQQQTATASYKDVPLEIPEELEIGETYQLRLISDKFAFSAHLIRDYIQKAPAPLPPSPPVVDAQLVADQKELCESLGAFLLPYMGLTVIQLSAKLLFNPSVRISVNSPTVGLTVIENEIQTIERIQFNQLIAKVKQIKSTRSISDWEKEILKASISVIGSQGLVNIVHANLKAILNGQIPPSLESTVNQLCEEFKRGCMQRAWS